MVEDPSRTPGSLLKTKNHEDPNKHPLPEMLQKENLASCPRCRSGQSKAPRRLGQTRPSHCTPHPTPPTIKLKRSLWYETAFVYPPNFSSSCSTLHVVEEGQWPASPLPLISRGKWRYRAGRGWGPFSLNGSTQTQGGIASAFSIDLAVLHWGTPCGHHCKKGAPIIRGGAPNVRSRNGKMRRFATFKMALSWVQIC